MPPKVSGLVEDDDFISCLFIMLELRVEMFHEIVRCAEACKAGTQNDNGSSLGHRGGGRLELDSKADLISDCFAIARVREEDVCESGWQCCERYKKYSTG